MDKRIRTIVVGVAAMHESDPKVAPPGEDPVLRPAIELAKALGATIHVVHVMDLPDPVRSAYIHALHSDAATREQAAEAEERLREQVSRLPGLDGCRLHVVEGPPAVRLCEVANDLEADLVIVGATRRGRIWRNILGSTAEGVLRRSNRPVLVIRQPFARAVRRILLTTDLSAVSPAIYEFGLDLTDSLFGAEELELRTLLVCWHDAPFWRPVPDPLVVQAATAKLNEFLEERRPRGRPVTPRVRTGNPSTEIIREAGEWHADLLVLGTEGRWNESPWMLGSTAAATLRGMSCNALVIPAQMAAAWWELTERTTLRAGEPFPGTAEQGDEVVLVL